METLHLSCPLTDRELLERGSQLAAIHDGLDQLEAERKTAAGTFKDKIEALVAEGSVLARQIRTKSEWREWYTHR